MTIRPDFIPKAVCFDLDGVLIDTMHLHADAWQAALKAVGLSVSRRLIYAWEGEPGRQTALRLISQARKGCAKTHVNAMALQVLADKEERFARLAVDVAVNRTWRDFLGKLAASHLPIALVTGTSSQEVQRVVPKAVLSSFDAVVTGDQVKHGKPHPEPYLTACKRLRVAPVQAIVVENAPYGIRSAKAAGIGLVIALASSLPASYLQEADVICDSGAAVRTLLQRLRRRVKTAGLSRKK